MSNENIQLLIGQIDPKVKKWIDSLTIFEHKTLLEELYVTIPAVNKTIANRFTEESTDIDNLFVELDNEFESVLVEPERDFSQNSYGGYHRSYGDYFEVPSFARIIELSDRILSLGGLDRLIKVLTEFYKNFDQYIDEFSVENEWTEESDILFNKIFDFVKELALPEEQKILYAIKISIISEYVSLYSIDKYLKQEFSNTIYSNAADLLINFKKEILNISNQNSTSIDIFIAKFLNKADRNTEAKDFIYKKALETNNYYDYIELLFNSQKYDEVDTLIRTKISKNNISWYGLEFLNKINIERNNWPWVIDFNVFNFIKTEDIKIFEDLLSLSSKFNLYNIIIDSIFDYFMTGIPPHKSKYWKKEEPDSIIISTLFKNEPKERFPKSIILLKMSIAINDADKILKWYDYAVKSFNKFSYGIDYCYIRNNYLTIARLIRNTKPTEAINFYKKEIENIIQASKSADYPKVNDLLNEIRSLLPEDSNLKQLTDYIKHLCAEYKTKTRLMKIIKNYKV